MLGASMSCEVQDAVANPSTPETPILLSVHDAAHTLGVSARTVDNDWAMARAWISARLSEAD